MKATQHGTRFAGEALPPGTATCGRCHGLRFLPYGPVDDEDRGQLCPTCEGEGLVPAPGLRQDDPIWVVTV